MILFCIYSTLFVDEKRSCSEISESSLLLISALRFRVLWTASSVASCWSLLRVAAMASEAS